MNHRKLNTEEIRDRARGCLLGVAIGDALGVPWETMKPDDIRARVGGEGVKTFYPPQQTRVADTAGLAAGSSSDDWQLTAVVAESLIATRGRIDLDDLAARHVRAMAESKFGWGRTTREAIEAIRDGRRSPRDPLPPAKPGAGCGNGVAMKVAPLAFASALRGDPPDGHPYNDRLFDDCLALGGLTHPDPNAGIAAYLAARLIRHLVADGRCRDGHWLVNGLREELVAASVLASRLDLGAPVPAALSDALFALGAEDYYARAVEAKRAFLGPESVAVAAAAFFEAHIWSGPSGRMEHVLSRVIGYGGDTDTNASIAGGLVGAEVGEAGVPDSLRRFRPEFEEAVRLADRLVDACS